MILTIVSFFAVLVVLIIAHEVGHFATAKAFKVKVDEFGLGFPPRLLSFKRGETIYSLNAIPLGGFTKMAGEEDPGIPSSLASKSIGARLIVLSAGSIMNAILPILLFSIAFMVPHNAVISQVMIDDVAPNSPAEMAGIQSGDIILSVNGNPVYNTSDLHRYIQLNLGEEISLLVKHSDTNTEDIRLIPRWKPPAQEGSMGVAVRMSDPAVIRQHEPFWRAVPMSAGACVETFVLFKNSILGLIIGATSIDTVAGPVGIAQITGEVARSGFSPLLEFAAFLSINLAILNILPLPALDGGRIVFVLLEMVRRGRRIAPKTEGFVHFIGFAMLIGVMLLVTYQDILRIVGGESLLR